MDTRFVLSEYVERAMEDASYDKLTDGTFSGVVPKCRGVIRNPVEELLLCWVREWGGASLRSLGE
jgi:hypothetical protein